MPNRGWLSSRLPACRRRASKVPHLDRTVRRTMGKGCCIRHASFGNFRDDVFTEVVAGAFVFVVFFQQLHKDNRHQRHRSPCWRAICVVSPAWLADSPVFDKVDNLCRRHLHASRQTVCLQQAPADTPRCSALKRRTKTHKDTDNFCHGRRLNLPNTQIFLGTKQ